MTGCGMEWNRKREKDRYNSLNKINRENKINMRQVRRELGSDY